MRPIEHQRDWLRIATAYHDAVVHVPGIVRRGHKGEPLRVLGLKEAARIAGLNYTDMSNRMNTTMPDHRPTLEGFVLHLLDGMDYSPLDELEHALGRVAITIPVHSCRHDVAKDLLATGQALGNVCTAVSASVDKHNTSGKASSVRELLGIRHDVDNVVANLYALLQSVEDEISQ